MTKTKFINATPVIRNYKNTSKSETINVNLVSKPLYLVDGKVSETPFK
jgi:hypothetical protein